MKSELELLFFESAIVDIDFSSWRSHIQIGVLYRWQRANEHVIPANDIALVAFHGARRFVFEPSALASSDGAAAAIEVNGVVLSKEHGVHQLRFDTAGVKSFVLDYEHYDIRLLGPADRSTARTLGSGDEQSFLRPDVERICRYIRRQT